MKNLLPVLLVILAVVGVVLFGGQTNINVNPDFLRIHIRANSNDAIDQNVKYKVKEEVVNYLAPFLTEATSKEKATAIIEANISGIETTANIVLKTNGFNYKAKAGVRAEEFPTRIYESLTLESGFYDALILELGSGSGDNWWCVVYPPLCFVNASSNNSNKVVYKSKLMEIIQSFFNC